jgi:hypothetical protein
LEDPTGTLTDVVSSIAVPRGMAYCDVYLLPGTDFRKFTSILGGYKYYSEYSRKNFMSGVVEINRRYVQNSFCLGFMNNTNSGVYVSLEVVAIVQD